MNDSRIWATIVEGALWLRIEGRATADDCPRLRAFCEAQLGPQRPKLYVVLESCELFDSTFLGTLLCLQKLFGEPGGDSVVLVGPAEECHCMLKRMGAHHLFPIIAMDLPRHVEWVLVSGEAIDRSSLEFQRQVMEAHSELAGVPGPLGDLYQPIARMVEQEFRTRQASSSGQCSADR